MGNYSDQEVKDFLAQQEANFRVTAKRSGYTGVEARKTLEKLNSQSQEERIANGRAQLENMGKNKNDFN